MGSLNEMESVEMPEPDAVVRRVAELGSDVTILTEAVRRGQAGGDFYDASYPIWWPGAAVYAETNAGLRSSHALRGWTFDDDNCIPRVVSPDGKVLMTAVSGNDRTGLRTKPYAQTKRPRREAGVRLVKQNAQISMLELLPIDDLLVPEAKVLDFGPTWFLLYYRDGDVVRSELSLAKSVSATGKLIEWFERLILPDIDLLDGPTGGTRIDEAAPDIDVPVERKAS